MGGMRTKNSVKWWDCSNSTRTFRCNTILSTSCYLS